MEEAGENTLQNKKLTSRGTAFLGSSCRWS